MNLNLCRGNHILEVEVNPKRTVTERHPGINDPYSDNKDNTSVTIENQIMHKDVLLINNLIIG